MERAWNGVATLRIGFFSGDEWHVDATTNESTISVLIDGNEFDLSRSQAVAVRDALEAALTTRMSFVQTAGVFRADGRYVVTRRNADSSGNAKTFDTFEDLKRLYRGLPGTFTAEDVETEGISGSRRHLVVRHVAEHPDFDCTISCRCPLTVEKAETSSDGSAGAEADAD